MSIDSNIKEIYKSISLSEFKEKYDYSNWLKLKEAIKSIYDLNSNKRIFLIANIWIKDYDPNVDSLKLLLEEKFQTLTLTSQQLNYDENVLEKLEGKRILFIICKFKDDIEIKLIQKIKEKEEYERVFGKEKSRSKKKEIQEEYEEIFLSPLMENIVTFTQEGIERLKKILDNPNVRIFIFCDYIPKIIDPEITDKMLIIFQRSLREPLEKFLTRPKNE